MSVKTLVAALALLAAGPAAAQDATRALAPTGTLRAAINYGNPVLAQRGPAGPGGVSVALARALGARLGVPVQLIEFNSAGAVTDALAAGGYDVCFLAIDPVRGQGLAFTAPYVLIEGAYAVRGASTLQANAEVDRAGTTVLVARGSAYDLYLTRALTQATLMRLPTGEEAGAAFAAGRGDVLAGVKQAMGGLVAANPGMRLLPGAFMAIEQAMATPRDRVSGDLAEALATLQAFIAEAKATGVVAAALAETGQHDARVAN